MLQEFELQADRAVMAELAGREIEDRRVPDARRDALTRGLDVGLSRRRGAGSHAGRSKAPRASGLAGGGARARLPAQGDRMPAGLARPQVRHGGKLAELA